MEYVPFVAILVAYVMIFIPRIVVSGEMAKLAGGYNNNEPRAAQAMLEGRGRRALGAHHNSFEAFPPFAIAVIVAVLRTPHRQLTCALCIAFLVIRALYIAFYIGDQPKLRSPMWALGTLVTATLMVLAIVGP